MCVGGGVPKIITKVGTMTNPNAVVFWLTKI